MTNSLPSLSIILPTFNEASWLPGTLRELRVAVAVSAWPNAEIVIVDDGSTDSTPEVLAADAGVPSLTVVRQDNAGRFAARSAGLRAASGELVLLLDSRVFAHPTSLSFLGRQLAEHPERLVWNGHVDMDTDGNPFAGFWASVVKIAWRRYFRAPTTTSYGIEDYDFFPKGTTFFVAPRSWLLDACESFDSLYGDASLANDDTLLIRPLARRSRINISPEFSCTYHSRDSWSKFRRHTFHRGTVFVDGYFRPGSRFFLPLLALLAAAPVAFVLLVKRPFVVLATLGASLGGLAGVARRCGATRAETRSLVRLSVPFAVVYGAGILRGLVLAGRTGISRWRDQAGKAA